MPDKKWRPEGWEKIRSICARRYIKDLASGKTVNAFEDGADALLKALFKMAEESPTKTFTIDSRNQQIYNIKNPLTLIPDDKEEV